MRYRRLGAGRPLVVLDAASDAAIAPELHCALAGSHRLVMPELPSDDVHLAGWLADFLEGLGTSRLAMLATEAFSIPALELTLLGNDQVSRIVILSGTKPTVPPADESHDRGTLESTAPGGRVRVLLVSRSQSLHEIVSLVRNFLSEG
jgi:hypothetical protein